MRRLLGALLAIGAVLAVGCGSGEAGTPQPAAPVGNLADALTVVPTGAGSALIVDQEAMKQRWGLAELTGADLESDDFDDYLHHLTSYLVAGDLALSLRDDGLQKAGWNWADVDWATQILSPGAPPVTVYQFRDGLDMSAVTGYFDDGGYRRSGPDDRPVYSVELKEMTGRPVFLTGAVVLPGRHQLVAGRDVGAVLAVIDGTAEGFGATPTGRAMLAATPGAEGLVLGWGADACLDPRAPIRSGTSSPSTSTAAATLGTITWWISGINDETHATATAGYPDESAAAADLTARTALVSTGRSPSTGLPYRDILGPTTVAASGNQLRYRMDAMERASTVVSLWSRREAPWALCGS